MAIQERGSQDTVRREVSDDQERYAREEFTDPHVQLDFAESLHGPTQRIDQLQAPRVLDGSAPRVGHAAQVYLIRAGSRI